MIRKESILIEMLREILTLGSLLLLEILFSTASLHSTSHLLYFPLTFLLPSASYLPETFLALFSRFKNYLCFTIK
jgi:hypothetical protein